MRIKNLLRLLPIILFLSLFDRPAQATHLYGGEFTYEYLGQLGPASAPFRYRIVMKHYIDGGGTGINPNVGFNFFSFNGTNSGTFIKSVPTSLTTTPNNLPLPIPANCPITFPPIKLRTYVATVDLPISFTGYIVTAVATARNSDITNIQPGNMSLYMQIPPPVLNNPGSSPVFTDTAVVVIFAGDTVSVINSAFDAQGDKLIYSFVEPSDFDHQANQPFTIPPSPVTYKPGYSLTQPFGPGGYASINASTGLAKYYIPAIPGNNIDRKYVVSLQVREYRQLPGIGDILIGFSVRDIQLVVKDYTPNNNTNPTFTFSGQRVINITEGDAIPPINFTFSDPNIGQNLKVEVGGVLLDGPAGRNATFTIGSNTISSNTNPNNPATHLPVANGGTGTLNFTSICGQAGTYAFNLTVNDGACPPGKKTESFSVIVDPYRGPDKINGDTTVCSNSTEAYNVASKATASYRWRLQGGGTIVGSATNPNIQINWATPGRHKVTAIETSSGNCQDSVSFFVNVTPGVNLSINATANAICVGTPVTLTAAGGTTYSWSDGTNTFTGAAITVSPTVTTTYTVSGAGITGCSGTNTITVTVNPLPPVLGVDKNVCAGQSATLQASGANIYTWSDGLNTYTGNNVTVTPTATTTYTVTGQNTTTGCISTDQVTLTVIPTPTPSLAFLADSYCKNNAPVALPAGTTVNGTSVATLDPVTLPVGNATVMLSLTANGCTGTVTKIVNIKAVPTANFGTLATKYCSNDPIFPLNNITGSTFQIDGVNATQLNPATLTPGNHTVSVTTTSSPDNCAVTATRTVVIEAAPVPTLAFLNAAYCANDGAVTLPGGTGGHLVNYTINGVLNQTTFNPATLGAGTHTISVTELTAITGGCSATTSRTIVVNPVPAPAFTGLNTEYCANDPVVNLAASLPGSTFTVNGVAASSFNPATLGVGNHTIVVSNTNALTTCTGTATQTIRIKAVPVANFGTLGTAYCLNAPAVPLNNVTGSTFTINGTAATSFNPATLGVGSHSVSVTTTSSPDNCSVTATRTVVVNAIPAPSLAFLSNAYCKNAGTFNLPTGTGIFYTINGGGSIPGGTIDLSTLPTGSNTIVMSETNGSNCTVTTTRTITVNPAPFSDFTTGPTSVCPGTNGVKYRILNPRETNYQWAITAGNGTIVSGQGTTEITVNWGAASSAKIEVKAVNSFGCLSQAHDMFITINPILTTPQPVGPLSVCQTLGAPVRYVMDNPTPGSTFTWAVTNGNIIGSNVNDTIFVSWNTPGTGSIVVNEASTGLVNCFGSSTPLLVTVLPSPNPALQITGATNVCENSTYQYTLPGAPGSAYAWSLTQNGVTTPLTGTSSTINFTTTTPGQYTLTAVETNAANCTGLPISKVITVTPTPVVTQIVGTNIICPQNLNNQLFYVNGPAGNSYNWSVTGGTIVKTATINNDSVYINFTANAPVMAVTVTPTSATLCQGADFTMPIIIDRASLNLASVSTTEQNDKAVELTFNMPSNSANRQDIEVFRRETGTAAFTKVGTVANTQTKFTDNGVQSADKVYEYKLVSFNECGDSLKTTLHNTMVLAATAQESAKSIALSWNPYLGWGTSEVDRYEVYLKADNGSFEMVDKAAGNASKITLSNVTGRGFNLCLRVKAVHKDGRFSWSNIDCLDFENKLQFYNVFTPNNDQRNDFFVIENVQLYPGNELSIYNRWGKEVYRKSNYDNTWDGKNQTSGTYYYLLKMANGASYKGWVEILK